MNQLRCASEVQSLGDREKRSNVTKLHLATSFAHLITGSKTNNNSNQRRKYLSGCGKRGVRCHRKKGIKKMKFNFLQEQTSRRECCEVRPRSPAASFWRIFFLRG